MDNKFSNNNLDHNYQATKTEENNKFPIFNFNLDNEVNKPDHFIKADNFNKLNTNN